MLRTTRIATFALAALIIVPVLAVAAGQRSKPMMDPKLKAQLASIGKTAKRLSLDKKSSLTSAVSMTSNFKVPSATAQGMFTNAAATDQASLLGYFAGEKLAIVRIGLPFLKGPFLAKELRVVGGLFPDTGAQKLADETAAKIETDKYDEAEVGKNLDLLAGAIGAAYGKKGEAANFNFRAGSTMGVATVLGILYGVEDFDMQKQVKSAYAKLMTDAQELAKSPTGDLAEAPKSAFTTFTTAKISDQDSAFAAIKPVDDAYLASLTE